MHLLAVWNNLQKKSGVNIPVDQLANGEQLIFPELGIKMIFGTDEKESITRFVAI
jgi:hypothetical protein